MRGQLSDALACWRAAGDAAVVVTVAAAQGSAPRDAGAVLIVSAREALGTIGGGRLEWDAIAAARAMIMEGGNERSLDVALGPSIGQCCGGHVTLRLKRADERECAALADAERAMALRRPSVLLFGAGHVGRALALALEPLPLRLIWIDDRAQEFTKAGDLRAEKIIGNEALHQVAGAAPQAAYVVLTHNHALDSLIAAAVLERGDFAYLGIIGSRTKRAVFESAFREAGLLEAGIQRITCPIGGSQLRDKRPEVIAALAAAEIMLAVSKPDAAA